MIEVNLVLRLLSLVLEIVESLEGDTLEVDLEETEELKKRARAMVDELDAQLNPHDSPVPELPPAK